MRGKTIISPILSQFTHSSTKHHDHLHNGALYFTLIIMIATFTTFVLTRGAASPTSARPPNKREHKTPEYFWSSALSHLFCNCSLPVLYPRDSSSTALEDSSCRLHYPEIALDLLLLIWFQINQNETHALRVHDLLGSTEAKNHCFLDLPQCGLFIWWTLLPFLFSQGRRRHQEDTTLFGRDNLIDIVTYWALGD